MCQVTERVLDGFTSNHELPLLIYAWDSSIVIKCVYLYFMYIYSIYIYSQCHSLCSSVPYPDPHDYPRPHDLPPIPYSEVWPLWPIIFWPLFSWPWWDEMGRGGIIIRYYWSLLRYPSTLTLNIMTPTLLFLIHTLLNRGDLCFFTSYISLPSSFRPIPPWHWRYQARY